MPLTKYNILAIDDDPAMLRVYKNIFSWKRPSTFDILLKKDSPPPKEALHPFCLFSSSLGKDGFQILKEQYDKGEVFPIAFVDMRMSPGWDGFRTVLELRELDPRIYIVLVTAFSDRKIEELQEQLQSRLILLYKPFHRDEILQLTRSLCQEWERTHQLQKTITQLKEKLKKRSL